MQSNQMILKIVIQQKEQENLIEVEIATTGKLIHNHHPLNSGCRSVLITSSAHAEE